MRVVDEKKSSIERFLERIGFSYIGVSEGKVYSCSYNNDASVLTFVIPAFAEGILEEKLSIEVFYEVNGQKVKNPESIMLYKSLGLESKIDYSISGLKIIIKNFKRVF